MTDVRMNDDRYQLALIVGSVRAGRFGPKVAHWFIDRAGRRRDFDLDVIDLADVTLPADLAGGGDTAEFTRRIDAADAVVVVTPEYNHGYPGQLKTAIDTVVGEWKAMPVAFVSYGGEAGGLRSVEQLRQVFASLGAVTVPRSLSFAFGYDQFTDDSGGLPDEPARANRAADALLDDLAWWTVTLRQAQSTAGAVVATA